VKQSSQLVSEVKDGDVQFSVKVGKNTLVWCVAFVDYNTVSFLNVIFDSADLT
jgi:hypothetical protein